MQLKKLERRECLLAVEKEKAFLLQRGGVTGDLSTEG